MFMGLNPSFAQLVSDYTPQLSTLPPTSKPVLTILAYVYGFMAFSSMVTMVHPRLRRPEAQPIRLAVNGWWPSALVAGLAALGGPWLAVPIFAGLSAWTLLEYLRMLPENGRDMRLDRLAFMAVPLHYAALISGSEQLFFGVILLWTFGVLPLATAWWQGPEPMLTRLPRIQLGLMLTVLALSHVPKLLFIPALSSGQGHELKSNGFMAFLLLVIMFSDAWQYFCGKLVGRHRLSPVISPKKTWEGLVGGSLIVSGIAAAAAPLLLSWPAWIGALMGFALCICGLLGDLLISALKRSAGIKDTGAVLPGQGGILDRCDSLLIAAPLYTYLVNLMLR